MTATFRVIVKMGGYERTVAKGQFDVPMTKDGRQVAMTFSGFRRALADGLEGVARELRRRK